MTTFKAPVKPKHADLQKAYLILKYPHDTSESLITAFDGIRKARKAVGAPTDEEQDLLRAMVVFAGAGLDALTKQLVRDGLPAIVEESESGREAVQKLVARHLRGRPDADSAETAPVTINPTVLARILMSEHPRTGITEVIVDDLCAGSLQSSAELLRVGGYLGFKLGDLKVTTDALKAVFDCRNRLIHELDIDFAQSNRNRFPRKKADMVGYTATLLTAATAMLAKVDSNLS